MGRDRQRWLLVPATRPETGGGHVARAMALAGALSVDAEARIDLRGAGSWRERLACGGVAAASLAEGGWHGIVLDDYAFTAGDVAALRAAHRATLVQFVDVGLPFPGIDLAINAAPGLAGDRLAGTPALLGPDYACIATACAAAPCHTPDVACDRVIVAMGWADMAGATERALDALSNLTLAVDVVLGPQAPARELVALRCASRTDWRLHIDPPDPHALACAADLAICAGGQTMLERLVCGVPTLVIEVADNQRAAIAGAAARGAVVDCGGLAMLAVDRLAGRVTALAHDVGARRRLASAGRALVDGRGASRVAASLLELATRRGEA